VTARPSSLAGKATSTLTSVSAFARRPRVTLVLSIVAAVAFIVLAVFSFREIPPLDSWSWQPLAALMVIWVPASLFLNTAEYRCIARSVDIRLPWRESFITATAAALANMLPIPGAAAVRTAAMVKRGGSLLRAGEVNALAAINWVAIAGLVVSGSFGQELQGDFAVPALIAACAAGLVLSSLRLASISSWRIVAELSVVEAAKVASSGARLYLCFKIIDSPISVANSMAIGASHALASIAGFFPAGLGLREALAGGLAKLVDVSPETAVAATIVDRFTSQIGIFAVLGGGALFPKSAARDVFRRSRTESKDLSGPIATVPSPQAPKPDSAPE